MNEHNKSITESYSARISRSEKYNEFDCFHYKFYKHITENGLRAFHFYNTNSFDLDGWILESKEKRYQVYLYNDEENAKIKSTNKHPSIDSLLNKFSPASYQSFNDAMIYGIMSWYTFRYVPEIKIAFSSETTIRYREENISI